MQNNVLYVLTKLELGGAQKVCLTLHKGLVEDGHSAFLVSGNEGVLVDEAQQVPGCILLKSFKREVSFAGILQDLVVFRDLFLLMRTYKKQFPDLIVHTHSTKAGILGRWAAFFARVRYRVHTVHGFGFHEYQRWLPWMSIVFFEWITALITTHIVCVSRKDQLRGARLLPGFLKKSTIIRAAVDRNHFERHQKTQISRAPLIIGTIACFKPQKNIFDMLEVFRQVQKNFPDIKLEIIGDGKQRAEIEAWIAKNNLLSVVVLHGWQSDVQSFLQQWDIFLMSSLWEGLPCSIVEARLAGLAVVAYDVGGISEVITQGKNGFLAAAGDKNELFHHLKNLLNDHNLLLRIQQYQDDLASFSGRSMIAEHKALYRSIKKPR